MSTITHWQSSVLPLFVRTIWTEGHHHVLLRHEDPNILKVNSNHFKNKRKRVISDSSETESDFRLATVKLPLEDFKNSSSNYKKIEQFPTRAFTATPICSKLIRCNNQNTVKPSPVVSPPPNNTLSERVMVWLDLALTSNSGNSPKVEIVRNNKRAATAKPKKMEVLMSPKSPIKEGICRVVAERKIGDDLGAAVTKVKKRQIVGMKRELHIFLPELPKKVSGSDAGSVLSSKCSSLLRK